MVVSFSSLNKENICTFNRRNRSLGGCKKKNKEGIDPACKYCRCWEDIPQRKMNEITTQGRRLYRYLQCAKARDRHTCHGSLNISRCRVTTGQRYNYCNLISLLALRGTRIVLFSLQGRKVASCREFGRHCRLPPASHSNGRRNKRKVQGLWRRTTACPCTCCNPSATS